MKIIIATVVLVAIYAIAKHWVAKYANNAIEPNWHVEKNAVPSKTHPLAGFFKLENCKDPWGWAIGPIEQDKYYISFCGPGGCFPEGKYRPNTTIYNDPHFEVIDQNTIRMKTKGEWQKMVRCDGRA